MTPDQIALVEQSFAMVRPLRGQMAGLFYARLFDTTPEVRPLFGTTNMNSQAQKLMATLAMIVGNMRHPDLMMSAAGELAERHVGYGVQPAHYDTVGGALLWALERALGDSWDDETEAAWVAVYTTLSGAMIARAYGVSADAAE